jgi:hypothetical protein
MYVHSNAPIHFVLAYTVHTPLLTIACVSILRDLRVFYIIYRAWIHIATSTRRRASTPRARATATLPSPEPVTPSSPYNRDPLDLVEAVVFTCNAALFSSCLCAIDVGKLLRQRSKHQHH